MLKNRKGGIPVAFVALLLVTNGLRGAEPMLNPSTTQPNNVTGTAEILRLATIANSGNQLDKANAINVLATLCQHDWKGVFNATNVAYDREAAILVGLLAKQGGCLDKLIAVLNNNVRPDMRVAQKFIPYLTAESVPALLTYAESGNPTVRDFIALALGAYPKDAERTLPTLCKLAADKDTVVAVQAIHSIARVNNLAKTPLDVLLRALDDNREEVRVAAANAMAAINLASADLLRVATERAVSTTRPSGERRTMIAVLGRATTAPDTVRVLATLLSDPNADIQVSAAESLRTLKGAASPARDAMIEALGRGNCPGADKLIEALQFCTNDGKSVEALLLKALGDQRVQVRRAALAALRTMKMSSGEAMSAVSKCLKDADPGARLSAAVFLMDYSKDAKIAAAILAARDEEKQPYVKKVLIKMAEGIKEDGHEK